MPNQALQQTGAASALLAGHCRSAAPAAELVRSAAESLGGGGHMSTEVLVAIIGFVTAVVGVVTAWLSKHKSVTHRHEGSVKLDDAKDEGGASTAEASSTKRKLPDPFKARSRDHSRDPYCPSCGKWRSPDSDICSSCGRKVYPYQGLTCYQMQCGHFMPPIIAFCTVCGEPIKEAEPETEVQEDRPKSDADKFNQMDDEARKRYTETVRETFKQFLAQQRHAEPGAAADRGGM
jgi:predicted nucleic acid-binding Zn ribbon protein